MLSCAYRYPLFFRKGMVTELSELTLYWLKRSRSGNLSQKNTIKLIQWNDLEKEVAQRPGYLAALNSRYWNTHGMVFSRNKARLIKNAHLRSRRRALLCFSGSGAPLFGDPAASLNWPEALRPQVTLSLPVRRRCSF